MSATSSQVRPLLALSVLARLPLAMLSIGWLVHVEHLTGSYAMAGLVAGTLAIAQGVGGPLLGRIADRRGQTAVLMAAGSIRSTPLWWS
jgi:MFS family permease